MMSRNLKEYVCHKVDKRIAELMKRKNRKRLAKEAEIARKEARGDFSHLKVGLLYPRPRTVVKRANEYCTTG